jgi:hypothetical protein
LKEPRIIGLDTPALGYEVSRAAFGESAAMMTAARSSGYTFLYGRKTTVRHYRAWRRANPKFTSTAYVAAHSKTVRKRLAAQKLAREQNGRGHSQRRRTRSAKPR